MAAITLKNVPPKLLSKLRKTAATNRRSLNQHALLLLTAASESEAPDFKREDSLAAASQLDAWRELCGAWKSDDSAAREIRRIYGRRSLGRKVNL